MRRGSEAYRNRRYRNTPDRRFRSLWVSLLNDRKVENGGIRNGHVLAHLLQKCAWDERKDICGEYDSEDVE